MRDKGANVLAGTPGGPTEREARRRLSEGLPLIVGLTRETTERLQDDLIGAGVIARLGPAPVGTVPLEAGSTPGVDVRLVLAAAGATLFVALWLLTQPADQKEPATAACSVATEAATPEPADLDVSAAIEPYGLSSYNLVGIARALSPVGPGHELELQLRDAPDGILIHARHVAVSKSSLERGFVSFRESLHEVGFSGGEEVWLIGIWEDLRSNPTLLQVPARTPR